MDRLKKPKWTHWCILTLIIGVFFVDSSVFAATSTDPILPGLFEDGIRVGYDVSTLRGFAEGAESLLKVLYLIITSTLVITAAAIDNSLVYGDAFHLTPALFKFWQIIRTFCNYTIGLYFVGSILIAFFKNKAGKVLGDLIQNIALAAILVNLSRWAVATLIDLSTIATVSLGALPLHAIKDTDAIFKENVYFMKPYTNVNVNVSTEQKADTMDFSLLYGCTQGEGEAAQTKYYLTCGVDNKKLLEEGSESEPLSRKGYKKTFIQARENDTKVDTSKISDDYCVYGKRLIKNQYEAEMNKCTVVDELIVAGKTEGIAQCATIDKLLTSTRNLSGPLMTIYSSILSIPEMSVTTNTGSVKEIVLVLFVKLIIGIALAIPLVVFMIIMLIRIIYLWLIIAFAPFIVLAVTLKRGDKISSQIKGAIANIFKPDQIITLIFLPAIVVFSLSISVIFLSLLQNIKLIEHNPGPSETAIETTDGCYNDVVTALKVQRDETNEGIIYDFDFTSVNISKRARETGADIGNIISRSVINLLGVALMRMVVFAALKASKFTEGVASSIEGMSKKWAGTIPLPLSGGIGMNTLNTIPDKIEEKYVTNTNRKQEALLDEMSKSYNGETRDLKQRFTEGQTNPGSLPGLNSNSIPEQTDFASDYNAAAKAYAQKAKSHYIDDKGNLTAAGSAYAQANNNLTASNINSSLNGVENWEQALGNKEMINWMHTEDSGKGYDNFYGSWDKRTIKRRNTVDLMEKGLASTVAKENQGKKITGTNNIHRYLYPGKNSDETRLTTYERNNTDQQFTGKVHTFTIPNSATPKTTEMSAEHMEAFNLMTILNKEKFASLPFYKFLESQTGDIELKDKTKYRARKEDNGNVLLEPVEQAQQPT